MKEVILLCGFPASGKSTLVKKYTAQGYIHLSRDISGGSMEDFHKMLNIKLSASNNANYILDCTYLTKELRTEAIRIIKANKYTVKCIFMNTSFEDAQYNAIARMISKVGHLIKDSNEYKIHKDANVFPVAVLYKAKKEFVKPTLSEGFDSIEEIKFKREYKPEYKNKAIIVDYDGTLRVTKAGSPHPFPIDVNQIEMLPGRAEVLKKYQEQGYLLLGVSNQSAIAKGLVSKQTVIDCFEHTNKQLGLKIDYRFCEHSVPPITCYCRKPGSGLGIELIEEYKLNPQECIFVGDMTTDKSFAGRCGFIYKDQADFFK